MYKVYDKYYFMPERMDYAARCLSPAAFTDWFNEISKINGIRAQDSYTPSGETVIELVSKGARRRHSRFIGGLII